MEPAQVILHILVAHIPGYNIQQDSRLPKRQKLNILSKRGGSRHFRALKDLETTDQYTDFFKSICTTCALKM